MKKFGLTLVALCLTALFLCSCGEKTAEKVTLTHVYNKTEIQLRDSFGIFSYGGSKISSYDGMIYVCGIENGEIVAAKVDPATLEVTYETLPIAHVPTAFCKTAEGFAAVYSKLDQTEERVILCIIAGDETVAEIDLSAHFSFNSASLELVEEGNISSRHVLLAANDSGIYASSGTECMRIAYDGTVQEQFALSGEVCSMAADTQGTIRLLLDRGLSGLGTGEIHRETGIISYDTWITDWYNITDIDGARVYADSFFSSVDSDAVYLNGKNGIYRVFDNKAEGILNWDNSGILYDETLYPVDGGNERFFLVDRDLSDGSRKLYCLERGEDTERTLVTVSYIGTNAVEIPEAAVLFNRQSAEYHVVCDSFEASADIAEDHELALSAFEEAVLTGRAGDVIAFDTDYEKYAEKGVFADLTSYMEEVEQFDCVTETLATDGKLYVMTPQFMVRTLAARSDFTETYSIDEWNTAAFVNLAQACAGLGDTMLFNGLTQRNGANILLQFGIHEFINGTKCSFDSPEFIALLDYLSNLTETPETKYDRKDGIPYRNGDVLLYSADIFDYGSWLALDVRFDGDFTSVGYPSKTGGSAVIEPNGYYAISGKSRVKDGAWAFVKFLLTNEEVSVSRGISGIPAVQSLWDSWTERQSEVWYFFPEGRAAYPDHILPNDAYIPASDEGIMITLTDEVKIRVRTFIEELSAEPPVREALRGILDEELSAFYSGIRTSEETAVIIQSRAKIYVSEHGNG